MAKRLIIYLAFLLFLPLSVSSQVIEVGLFNYKSIKKVMIIAQTSAYTIYGDGIRISELYNLEGLRAELDGGKISLKSLDHDFGKYSNVEFRALTQTSTIYVKGLVPKTNEQEYNNHIKLRVFAGGIQIVNIVNIENYVSGVVEAETGKERPFEFYKVQSIISRTYALANFRRHEDEGFQLCDAVHCQVYHGKSKYEELIPKAVMSTKGIVIVDSNIDLITAAFSSNCGGKTRNAEEVWSKQVSYLKSQVDSFCLESPHAKWTKTISESEWKAFKKTENAPPLQAYNGEGSIIMDDTFSEFNYQKTDLNSIRTKFNLNSTRFVIEDDQDKITFIGRGFGHGVGLCQEGAIEMAKKGYSYKEILEYYYTDIHLIQLSSLNFFKSE
jgi:stage II sporulation protein D